MGQAESRQEQFWEACGFGHTEKVKELIDEGVDVNWVSKTHDSCPIHAASQGKSEIVKMLIQAGCDVNARDERQCTALHHASMNGFTCCAKLLLEAGAVVNAQDKNQWSALHNAAYWARTEMTDLLLSHKADVTLRNKDERSAIHEVARSRSKDEDSVGKVTQSLILSGSDIEGRAGTDGYGYFTVLMSASYHGHDQVVKHLLQSRCEVNAQSSNKWTALHWASDRSHAHIVRLLLENQADASIQGAREETARDRARLDSVREMFDRYCECTGDRQVQVGGDSCSPQHLTGTEQVDPPVESHQTEDATQSSCSAADANSKDVCTELNMDPQTTAKEPELSGSDNEFSMFDSKSDGKDDGEDITEDASGDNVSGGEGEDNSCKTSSAINEGD